MSFDDYVGVIGSFCWYMYERIPGFEQAKEEHPSAVGAAVRTKEIELLSDWGGVVNSGPVERGPIRLADLYKIAARHATKPIKVSVGRRPGQPRLARLLPALQGRPRAELRAGADLQRRDEGAGRGRRDVPPARGPRRVAAAVHRATRSDYEWIADVIAQCVDGVDAKIAWHFCFGNAWGNKLSGIFPTGYETVLPYFYDVPIDQFVLDFANREMADIGCLKSLPDDKEVAVGVLDVRTSSIETPEEVAERIRKVLKVVPAERVYLTTDCGMKPLCTHGREDEAEGARRRRRDRPQGALS